MNLSVNPISKQRAFSFEVVSVTGNFNKHQDMTRNATIMAESGGLENSTTLEPQVKEQELRDGIYYDISISLSLFWRWGFGVSNVNLHSLWKYSAAFAGAQYVWNHGYSFWLFSSLMEYSGCAIGIESEDILDFYVSYDVTIWFSGYCWEFTPFFLAAVQNMDSCQVNSKQKQRFRGGLHL